MDEKVLEKAVELSKQHCGMEIGREVVWPLGCEKACLEMAEWQKREVLEKSVDYLKKVLAGKFHPGVVLVIVNDYIRVMNEENEIEIPKCSMRKDVTKTLIE